jgi:hypothetical protein
MKGTTGELPVLPPCMLHVYNIPKRDYININNIYAVTGLSEPWATHDAQTSSSSLGTGRPRQYIGRHLVLWATSKGTAREGVAWAGTGVN